jgi:hypothetical protein
MNKEMAKVFLSAPDRAGPALPFAEHVMHHGRHPLALKNDDNWAHAYMARYEFPNGHTVSVITGGFFYCRENAPYEIMWETTDEEDDGVQGYVTDEQLMLFLAKVSQLPERISK